MRRTRPGRAEVRRRSAGAVVAGERLAAVALSHDLDRVTTEAVPDPAAVADLGRRYDMAWQRHGAAPSFHFQQAMATVAHLHRCRWCDYHLRGSADRCPESGRAAEPTDAGAPPPVSSGRLWAGLALKMTGGIVLLTGWPLVPAAVRRLPTGTADLHPRGWGGLVVIGTGATLRAIAARVLRWPYP